MIDGGQGAVLAGQVAVDVVGDHARVLVGCEVEGQDAVGQVDTTWRVVLHRAFDQGRAGGQVLLDDQEVALPFGRVVGDVAPCRERDAGLPPSATWLARFSKWVALTATPKPTGSTLPSSSGAAG